MGARTLLALAAAFAACALGAPIAAGAAPVPWTFDATVRNFFSDPSPGPRAQLAALGIVEGAPVSGAITFDTATRDVTPDPSVGSFLGAILAATVDVGSLHLSLAHGLSPNSVTIGSGVPHYGAWSFDLHVPPAGFVAASGHLELADSTRH